MPISITYWRDVMRKLTTTEMDDNFNNLVDAIADAGLSPTMPEGQIYIGDNTNTATLETLDKNLVGLPNVDNTSDANKPISTATQTALDFKANINSPTLTGTPLAPTATNGTNTTQIATTAFVTSAIGAIPTPPTPTLATVTTAGNTTTNSITLGGLAVNMPSGSGTATSITKGGAGEALTVIKTSGSGNVASFTGGTTSLQEAEITSTTANRPAFIDSAKKIISATGVLFGAWLNGLTAKSTPIGADVITTLDSANGFEAKKTTLTELWTNYLRAFVFSASLSTNRIPKSNASGVLTDGQLIDNGSSIATVNGFVYIGTSAANAGGQSYYLKDFNTTNKAILRIDANNVSDATFAIGYDYTNSRSDFSFGQVNSVNFQNPSNRTMCRIGGVGGNNFLTLADEVTGLRAFGTYHLISDTYVQEVSSQGIITSRSKSILSTNGGIIHRFETKSNTRAIMYNGGLAIGVSSEINASACLDLQDTNKGFLPNRLTTVQRLAITSPATGLQVFDSNLLTLCTFNGGSNIEANWKKYSATSLTGTYTPNTGISGTTRTTVTVTVTGAVVGQKVVPNINDAMRADFVTAGSWFLDMQAYVSATDTVTITFVLSTFTTFGATSSITVNVN